MKVAPGELDWMKRRPEFPPRVKAKPQRDPNKIATRLADAYEEEKAATHKLRRAMNRWDSAVRTRERLEKELDKATMGDKT